MWVLPLSLVLSISACSSRFEPAPVVNLSTKIATPENLTEITTDTYIVELGDTLFAVAFYSGNDYRDIAKLNNISPPYTIKLGQSLRLNPVLTEQNLTEIKSKTVPVQKTDKKGIDPKQQQAYRNNKQDIHHKNKKNQPLRSDRPHGELDWIWPANGSRTVATVGSDGGKRGLDIKGRLGSKVVAAAGGKVVYAGNALKGYGNLVILKHNNEYLSAYAHNNAILVGEQTYVKKGQQIATMGNSGASEVMLHFEIRKKGKSIDPFRYLPAK
ncbi:MAG: lipoprotein NlpD [Alphaproteobacteria bacterium]|jgi:lipoprotein NlpD